MRRPPPDAKQLATMRGWEAYNDVCSHLNRAQRRTAQGRLVVAEAEIARLRAENEALREALAQEDDQ